MTLIFGRHYEKEYQEFSRYIDTIPGDQKPPAIHVELHFEMTYYTPINDRAFINAFCTSLAEYDSVTSFTTAFSIWCKDLDVKVLNSCQPVFQPSPFTALTTLRLDSTVSDHFFGWLLRSAAASPICELFISRHFRGRLIHIPTLRKLTLEGGSLTTSQVIRLLSEKAHSSISELTFLGEPCWEMRTIDSS